MRSLTLVAVTLLASACAPVVTEQDEHAVLVARATAARREREARLGVPTPVQASEMPSRPRHMQGFAGAVQPASEKSQPAPVATCESGREERLRIMAEHMAKVDRIAELREWEEEHCQIVDRSKPVVRVVKDSRGEYHTVEGRSRGVDRDCDAKPPADIATRWARNLTPGQFPLSTAQMACQREDEAGSELAVRFYASGKRRY